jgi:hypothetical protein
MGHRDRQIRDDTHIHTCVPQLLVDLAFGSHTHIRAKHPCGGARECLCCRVCVSECESRTTARCVCDVRLDETIPGCGKAWARRSPTQIQEIVHTSPNRMPASSRPSPPVARPPFGHAHGDVSVSFCGAATRRWRGLFGLLLLLLLVAAGVGTDGPRGAAAWKAPPVTPPPPYRLGSFVHPEGDGEASEAISTPGPPSATFGRWASPFLSRVAGFLKGHDVTFQRALRLFVFCYNTWDSIQSILEDQWAAERDPDRYFGQRGIWHRGERRVVQRRTVQASVMRKYVGVGYTPRYVFGGVCGRR